MGFDWRGLIVGLLGLLLAFLMCMWPLKEPEKISLKPAFMAQDVWDRVGK